MNKIKTLTRISSLAILMMFVMSIFAQAQGNPPLAPVNLKAVIVNQDIQTAVVLLTWDKNPEGPTPTYFNVFIAKKNTDDLKDFVQFAEVKYIGKDNIPFEVRLPSGDYSFYVNAILKEGGVKLTSAPSPIIKVKIDQQSYKYIQITSKLPFDGGIMIKIGDTFKYKVEYKTNVSGNIKFKLDGQSIPENFKIDENNGTIEWKATEKTWFGGSIIAYSVDFPDVKAYQSFKIYSDSLREDPPKDAIRITSIPSPNYFVQLKVGETFTYKVTYETNLTDEINFKLDGQRPDDFKIDKKSGEIVWTAKANGAFAVFVIAYSTANPKIMAQQAFKVFVGTGNDKPEDNRCAYITGQVVLEDGTVATEGVIQAWVPNANNKGEARFDAGINKNGTYVMKVPAGVFSLEIWGKTFQHEWYENATDLATSTKIEVACGDTITANFTVKLIPVPKVYTVSGNVTSETDGTPLAAYVYFTPNEVLNGQTREFEKRIFMTKTDAAGHYTIDLPDNFNYVGYANVAEKKSNYIGEYYDNVTNALEASKITLTGNTTIDFSLKALLGDVQTGSLTGTIVDSANTGIKSKVIAILTNMIGSVGKYVVTVETDDSGNFTFDKLMYGEYIILSFPATRDWIPGYYKAQAYTVLNWKDASLVKIANAVNGPITVKHALRTTKGISKIIGFLQEGKKKFVFDNLPATPLAGAMLYVVNANGKVVDYAYSDNNGKFNLDEVSIGTNTLIADKVGYETSSTTVQTDMANKSLADVSLSLSLMSVSGVEDNLTANVSLYPVPAYAVSQLTLNGLANAGTYRIVDALGNVLGNGLASAGTTQIEISNLSTGNYYLMVNSDMNLTTVPFSVVK